MKDKFSTLASHDCWIFVVDSKHFIRSGMGSLESIMAIKDHFGFNLSMIIDLNVNPKVRSLCSRCMWILLEVESIW